MRPSLSEQLQPLLVEKVERPPDPPVHIIKALTLHQPFATLVIHGLQQIETRDWEAKYRGLLAIHAAKTFPEENYKFCFQEPFVSALAECGIYHPAKLIRSAVLGVVKLVKCERSPGPMALRMTGQYSDRVLKFGDFSRGRWLWYLENPKRFVHPHYCRGDRSIWLCALPDGVKTVEEQPVETVAEQTSFFLPSVD